MRLAAGAICAGVAVLWIGGGVAYVLESLGLIGLARLLPHEVAAIVMAVVAPPALLALLAAPWWLERAPAAAPDAMTAQMRALSETAHTAQERIGATLRDMDERVDRLHRTVAELAKPAAGFEAGAARLAGLEAGFQALAKRSETLLEALGRIDALGRELTRAGDAARETARQVESASGALDGARARLAAAGAEAAERVVRSAQLLEERGQTTAAIGNSVAARLINAERRLADLEQSLARQMGALDALAERARDTAGSLAAEAERLRVGGVRVDPFRRTS